MSDNLAHPPADEPGDYDPIAELKRHAAQNRPSPEQLAEILALFPPTDPEEEERQLREMQEKGGISSEEFLTSLGLEDGAKS